MTTGTLDGWVWAIITACLFCWLIHQFTMRRGI